jgi:hypothetical protein
MQAVASMVAALPRDAPARKQLQAPGASNELLLRCVQARGAPPGASHL